MAETGLLSITLTYSSQAAKTKETELHLAPGSTVQDAVTAAGGWSALGMGAETKVSTAMLGIWGKLAKPDQLLADGDRVELYRPLTVDPKVARRERFARQGARTAGLFKSQRAGSKAGY